MPPTIKPAPVRRSIRVGAPRQRAFEVFTAGIGRWWPKAHHIGAADFDKPVIEPRTGGRWYERGVDSPDGWNGLLQLFAQCAAQGKAQA